MGVLIMLNVLINDLTTTDFLLLVLVLLSFVRTMIELVKLFNPAQIFMKNKRK